MNEGTERKINGRISWGWTLSQMTQKEQSEGLAQQLKSFVTVRRMRLTDVWNPKTRLFINLSLIALICCEAIFANFYSELNLLALSSTAPSAISKFEASARGPSISTVSAAVVKKHAHRRKSNRQGD